MAFMIACEKCIYNGLCMKTALMALLLASLAVPATSFATSVESSAAIQQDIAGVSPQAASVAAPAFAGVDSLRSSFAGLLDSQIAAARQKVAAAPKARHRRRRRNARRADSKSYRRLLVLALSYLLICAAGRALARRQCGRVLRGPRAGLFVPYIPASFASSGGRTKIALVDRKGHVRGHRYFLLYG